MNQYKCERCDKVYFVDGKAFNIDDYHHIVCEFCEGLYQVDYKAFLNDFLQPERSKRENTEK
jgi:DNA-directed RNA polymerase subunit RPC12/RpoP